MKKKELDEGNKPGPYVYEDTTRLRRGKYYDLTLISLLWPSMLGQKGEGYVIS